MQNPAYAWTQMSAAVNYQIAVPFMYFDTENAIQIIGNATGAGNVRVCRGSGGFWEVDKLIKAIYLVANDTAAYPAGTKYTLWGVKA